ncbi:MAG TPA: DNA/RNA non-specific endonuclease [Chitinophagaceae bacterium]|nr:DNA/RNA non-specific endonuclease [Chitinophagaceae bacterium]
MKHSCLAVLAPALLFSLCTKQHPAGNIAIADNDHVLLGNPSHAAATIDSSRNYLVVRDYYSLSYDSARGIPNWASWHLDADDLGTVDRSNNFRSDTSLPAGWYRATDAAYRNTGFDRGHNCPSGDRTRSVASNAATYLMSNIIPQAPENNQGMWARMEDSIRAWVRTGKEAFIQMGSYGMGGTGDSGFAATIAKGRIAVPAYIWKLVVLIPAGHNDLKRIDLKARVIAVIAPNTNSVNSDWKIYRTNGAAIQKATGYRLLTNIPSTVRWLLLTRVDDQ